LDFALFSLGDESAAGKCDLRLKLVFRSQRPAQMPKSINERENTLRFGRFAREFIAILRGVALVGRSVTRLPEPADAIEQRSTSHLADFRRLGPNSLSHRSFTEGCLEMAWVAFGSRLELVPAAPMVLAKCPMFSVPLVQIATVPPCPQEY
jgi:hypothetical protein